MTPCLLAVLLTVPSVAPAVPSVAPAVPSWSQWRGPNRDCLVGGPTWPASLQGEALKQLWRVELGEGYPGPIVVGDCVFVAETRGRKEEVVRALDRRTGVQLWEHRWEGSMTVPFFAASNGSWIRSTPTHDGDSLYVAGMRDVLICLDPATGKERWRADLMARHKTPLPAFGFVCSPLVDDTGVYVQAAASVVKLDKKSGKTLWRSLDDGGGMYGSAFSSPVFATLAGRRQLVVQTRSKLAGLSPADGEVLWSQPVAGTRGMNVLTPTTFGDGVFVSAYQTKTYLYHINAEEKSLAVKEAWAINGDANMTSPVIVNGHAYFLLRNQRLTCVDLKNGKTCWTTAKAFGQYWSMVAQGDRILALDQRGSLYLIEANPTKFVLIDERQVSKQEAWGHLAVVGDEVFVRELKALSVYRWRHPEK